MNRTTRISAPIAIAATAALAFGGAALATTAPDEQAALDAAIESFGERLTAAGWELTGTPSSGPTSDDGTDPDAGEPFQEALAECFGEDAMTIFATMDSGAERPQASSGDYSFSADVDATSELGAAETVELNLVSLSDDDLEVAETLIDRFGADDLGECFVDLLQELLGETIAGGDDEMAAMLFEALEFDTASETDLGIGDRSARLGVEIALSMGIELSIDMTIDIALVDGRLAMLMYIGQAIGVGEDDSSGFDTVAELEQVVADLSDS